MRSTSSYRYVPPTAYYSGTGTGNGTSTGTAGGSGDATADLPVGVGATGVPTTVVTVKPGTTADPVYAEAATGVVTKRRLIDLQGISVNEILAYTAAAGALIGLVGGAGLWFTRGAR